MNYKTLNRNNKQALVVLFESSFSSAEGEEEGKVVANLVSQLCSDIDNKAIIGLGAYYNGSIIGAIFFTRLRFSDPISVYMLSPVAVSTDHQGKGVGQALIRQGIEEMKNRSVSILTTYGDPAFYAKVGFQSLSQQTIRAPFTPAMPEGWLGQSLIDEPIPTINERPTCVEAFNDPTLW